jgi:hypothetical protein
MTLTSTKVIEIAAGTEGVQGGPWKLDKFACYIWAPSEKGGDFPLMDEPGEHGRVAELRGWGYYTGNGHGALGLHPDEAKNRQRLTGEHVARLDPATVKELCRLALIGIEAEQAYRPCLIRNEEGRFIEFVERDVATVTGEMMALNVEPIYDMMTRKVIGYRLYDDALFLNHKESPK